MTKFNQKSIISLFFILLIVFVSAQQKPYEVPTLDNSKKVTKLKLLEDFQNKKIKSSYMKGFTEKDSLFIKVKGTYTLQHVMVSVISKKKEEVIEIEIVKKDWKDVKRSGKTKNGLYQESFETARNFGIIIHSKKPNLPFDLIVWTSEEIIPKSKSIFYPSSEFNGSNTNNTNSTSTNKETTNNNSDKEPKSNLLMYVIIGALGIIAILLFMILKKKKSATIILFLLSYGFANAGIIPGNPVEMMETASQLYNMRERFNDFVAKDEHGNSTHDYLTGSDKDYLPDMDPEGQPKLPSSCLEIGSRKRNNDSRIDNSGNDRTSGSNDTIDEDRPKYDKDGKPIDYGDDNNSNQTSSNQVMDDYDTVGEGDGLKKDKDGNPIPGSAPEGTTNENPFVDNEMVTIHGTDHPKYDKDGKVINYETSNRPKYDKDGVPINYGPENDDTNYNRNGRPKYDKDGKPIYYDDLEKPKYDKNGMAIKYKDATNNEEGESENLEENNVETKGDVTNDNVTYDNKSENNSQSNGENANQNNNSGSNNDSNSSGNSGRDSTSRTDGNNVNDDNDKKEGCDCLEKAYQDLEEQRFKFEKLRIIYNSTKKVVDWSISFGDDVSGIHAVSGLAWQKEKQKILKNMDKFYKAYDNKHKEFVRSLGVTLHEIDRCEAKLGFEDWYSKVGFIYYNFMNDKYKRN